MILIISCGGAESSTEQELSTSSESSLSGSELHVLNYPEYFPDDIYELFEEETGVSVRVSYRSDEEDMVAAVLGEPGVYDVLVPSLSLAEDMLVAKTLRKLDAGLITNSQHLAPQYAESVTGSGSCAPIDFGTTGIAVNTASIDAEIESWQDLWDPKYAGHVSMVNNSGEVIGATLRYLGYSINSSNPSELAEAETLLKKQKPLLIGYLGAEDYWDSLESGDGDIWMAQAYSGDVIAIAAENPDIEYVLPIEGTDLYFDCLAISRDAPNAAAAHAFINFVLRPDIHAMLNNYTGYATTNATALVQGLIDEEIITHPANNPDPNLIETWEPFTPEQAQIQNRIWSGLLN